MLSAKRRRRAATVPGAGQDGGVQGGRGSPVKGGPDPGALPFKRLGVALAGVKPRCAGAVWIGEPPLCCTRIGTHASLLFAEGSP